MILGVIYICGSPIRDHISSLIVAVASQPILNSGGSSAKAFGLRFSDYCAAIGQIAPRIDAGRCGLHTRIGCGRPERLAPVWAAGISLRNAVQGIIKKI